MEKCPADTQIEAIYTLIGERPAATTVVVKAEAVKSDKGLINMLHAEKSATTALQNEVNRLKKQMAVERQQNKAYKEWAEKDRHVAVSLERERYYTLCSRLHQDNGDGWAAHILYTAAIKPDDDDVNRLAALRMGYDCYNRGEAAPQPALKITPPVLEITPPPPAPISKPRTPIVKPPPTEELPSHCEGCRREADPLELQHCSQCRHSFHIRNDLLGCWLFECVGDDCDKPVCDNCRKANGTSKMSPKCSKCK
jgi:hypothetical protein